MRGLLNEDEHPRIFLWVRFLTAATVALIAEFLIFGNFAPTVRQFLITLGIFWATYLTFCVVFENSDP